MMCGWAVRLSSILGWAATRFATGFRVVDVEGQLLFGDYS